ncbi:hypothetical protein A3740_25570, partial [Oleiphilus sp. HI0068]
ECRLQAMIKYPGAAEFHSYDEYLYAALQEGDPRVVSYIPQPLKLRYRGVPYRPDAYVLKRDGRYIIELKPRGEWDDEKLAALKAFCQLHNLIFELIANESARERETEALNWWRIVRVLYRARHVNTDNHELNILLEWPLGQTFPLRHWLHPLDRESRAMSEVALFRLLHRGKIQGNLTQCRLSYDLELSRCPVGDMPSR